MSSSRTHLPTAIAITVVAYAGADVIHEAAHALVCVLSGYGVVSISTVATQSEGSSRLVAAAGSIANVLTGLMAWLAFRNARRFGATQFFLWLFGGVSLMNVGYLVTSAVLDNGDWARVIAELEPPLVWRGVMGLAGLALYMLVVRQAANLIKAPVKAGQLSLAGVDRLSGSAYWAGSLLMVAGALVNPIGLNLVVTSGIGAGFALTCGLLFVPKVVAKVAGPEAEPRGEPLALHRGWIAAGVCMAIVFVAVLGPGIRF